jgi:hydroxyacylglutathione hydrolase
MGAAVTPLVDAGLGNTAYLVNLGDRRALVVDASRDLRAVRRAVDKSGLTVAYAAETHLHADFLSGARQLASSDGATVLASAAGNREFLHSGLGDGVEVDLGGLRLRALGTPGHTDEHLAYLLLDDERPLGVFTGGSLLVGAAARTDLVDPARTEELARSQYRSIQRLIALPDDVAVWPTHGAGSFCSAPAGRERTSTIGRERAGNPLLQAADEDAFVTALLGSLGSFPPYFLRLAEVNRRGPALLDGSPALVPLSAHAVRHLVAGGAQLVDVRPVEDFGAGHIPGSLSIALRDVFASWLGWVTDPDHPIIIIRDQSQDPEEIVWQAAKIGYDNVRAELDGGIDAWREAGLPLNMTGLARRGTSPGRSLVDVRQAAEFVAGHVPGAINTELGTLTGDAAGLPEVPIAVMCGHGERAMTAASLLARAGRTDVEAVLGGPRDLVTGLDLALATGP